jgi:hypothetical protein
MPTVKLRLLSNHDSLTCIRNGFIKQCLLGLHVINYRVIWNGLSASQSRQLTWYISKASNGCISRPIQSKVEESDRGTERRIQKIMESGAKCLSAQGVTDDSKKYSENPRHMIYTHKPQPGNARISSTKVDNKNTPNFVTQKDETIPEFSGVSHHPVWALCKT